MVLKVEIRSHSGIGRITKIISDDKVLSGPNLIEPISIPVFHKGDSSINLQEIPTEESEIILGYIPALHNFSALNSEQDVLEILKKDYKPKIESLDFISFPLDMASSFRSFTHYPDFILQASKEMALNFAWIYSEKDSETDWTKLHDLPLMILGDLATIYKNQRHAWRYLVNLEKTFPLTLKYAPAIPPVLFPLFVYLGIDFFDSLYGKYMAQNNIFLDTDELIPVKDFENFIPPCSCIACHRKSEYTSTKHWLFDHNLKFTQYMIKKVQHALHQGTLRDLVKKQVLIDPSSTALLRIADLDEENQLLDKYTPSFNKTNLILTSISDYIRPEIKMYHSRIKERFTIPKWNELILLIPCSAKKPYSISKSHRIFSSVIKNVLKGKRHSILELIVTSPLGVVPRFLEQVYPAGMYDIPVTGNWTELEENLVENLLVNIFSQLSKEIPIVSYLAEPEKSIIQKFSHKFPQYKITILDLEEAEISEKSLQMLRSHLYSIKDTITASNSKNNYELEFFKAMANYQFGKGAGDIIFPPECEVKRKGYLLTAFLFNKQLATLHLGRLSITVYAASKLAESFDNYKVYFADSEIIGSAIYTPGIIKADQQIKPEDDVLVISEKTGKFLAIGKSNLSGFELENCNYGLGISIKKKFK